MTDALHKCARCGVTDAKVQWSNGLHPDRDSCFDALQRELAEARALLRECVPVINEIKDDGTRRLLDDGSFDVEILQDYAVQARALLARIQQAGGSE